MKRQVIISAISILSLVAISMFKPETKSETEPLKTKSTESTSPKTSEETLLGPEIDDGFYYEIGSRFLGIRKSDIKDALSIQDFLDPDMFHKVHSYNSIELYRVNDEGRYVGLPLDSQNDTLSLAQLDMLNNADYGTNVTFRIDLMENIYAHGPAIQNLFTPYHTLVPHQEAEYIHGNDVLVRSIRMANYENTKGLRPDDLRPAKMYFTISKEGSIENIQLDKGTGYPRIDLELSNQLKATGSDWKPARDENGKPVAQRLVFFFGLPGC